MRFILCCVTESSQVVSLSLNIDPSEHALYDGVLTGIPLGRIGSQEAKTFEIGLSFIAEGQFRVQGQAYTLTEAGRLLISGMGEISIDVNGADAE